MIPMTYDTYMEAQLWTDRITLAEIEVTTYVAAAISELSKIYANYGIVTRRTELSTHEFRFMSVVNTIYAKLESDNNTLHSMAWRSCSADEALRGDLDATHEMRCAHINRSSREAINQYRVGRADTARQSRQRTCQKVRRAVKLGH